MASKQPSKKQPTPPATKAKPSMTTKANPSMGPLGKIAASALKNSKDPMKSLPKKKK